MQASQLLLEEPIRLASILESSTPVDILAGKRINVEFAVPKPKRKSDVPHLETTYSPNAPYLNTYEGKYWEWMQKKIDVKLLLGPGLATDPQFRNPFSSMTKIIGTLGPTSRDVDTISKLLNAGMSVARFDFSWGDEEYHQKTLDNLKIAVKATRRLCAVMFDTVGPELQIINKGEHPIALEVDGFVTLTPDLSKEPSAAFLPINWPQLADAVKPKDTIFVGQYLFTGSESTSVWLEVVEVQNMDVKCVVKNSATLTGGLFTAHATQVPVTLPTLSETDKKTIATWGVRNSIDFLSLSFTRNAEDVRQARAHMSKLGDLYQTQIFAKIESVEGLRHFDEILKEADGIILSRGDLGIDLPPEKVFLFQKAAMYKCNMAGKPAIITRVVDTMTDTPRPTRAEATDVANAVLDGADGILLGAETLRGIYPVDTVSTVQKICAEAEKVFNQAVFFKKTVKATREPMGHLESIASSAVRAATKVRASVIVVFTTSGRAARLVAKYKPTMPVLVVVIPKLTTNHLRWSFTGAFQARQCLAVRGLFPMLADPRHPKGPTDVLVRNEARVSFGEGGPTEVTPDKVLADYPYLLPKRLPVPEEDPKPKKLLYERIAESSLSTNESILKVALDHGKVAGIIKAHDRVVVFQKVGDSSVVKIIELDSF